jgi:uncharacterized membrane protein
MKIKIKKNLVGIYFAIIHSIAFIPITFSILFIILVLVLLNFEDTAIALFLIENLPWLKMESASHASNILTTLLMGMISLTVFSFSVVMIILNQAAQNFIPKVLYKLTEDKFMQVTLGMYIGTIIYYIILLINLGQGENKKDVFLPDLAFILGIFLSILNLFLFIYFIHRTIISIHAKKLSKRLFYDTKEKLKVEREKYFESEEIERIVKETKWFHFKSNTNGYLQSVDDELIDLLTKNNLILKIEPFLGGYVVEKMLLFSLSRNVEEKLLKEIESGLIFYDEERIEENSKHGFSQLTEIAVKALSTGLNDPGTAIFCIEYLTELFCMRINQTSDVYKRDNKQKIRVISKNENFMQLLYDVYRPLRNYGKSDIHVLESLVRGLSIISLHDKDEKYKDLLNDNLYAIMETLHQNASIEIDKIYFKNMIASVCNKEYFEKAIYNYKLLG